jgi:putative transcriptional regulator
VERTLVAIIETEEFIERARKITTLEKREDLLWFRHATLRRPMSFRTSAALANSDGLPKDAENGVARAWSITFTICPRLGAIYGLCQKQEIRSFGAGEKRASRAGSPHRGAVQRSEERMNMRKGRKSSVVKGAEQALAFLEGKANGTRLTTVEFAAGTVRSIRRSLNLSQARFAQEFGFTPATVRNWEQGRNQPDKAARILLAVIRRHPEIARGAARSVLG